MLKFSSRIFGYVTCKYVKTVFSEKVPMYLLVTTMVLWYLGNIMTLAVCICCTAMKWYFIINACGLAVEVCAAGLRTSKHLSWKGA